MPLELPSNYFDLFQLPPALEVDSEQLTERYRALQRELHPDRFATSSDPERRLAASAAAQVNQAYRTLSDRHERATYLLQMQDISIDNEKDTSQDSEFLMQQMELREQIEELDGEQAFGEFRTRLGAQAQELWQTFAEQYTADQFPDARETLLKLCFYRRLQQQLESQTH